MAVSVAVYEIFSVKEWCDLESRVSGFALGPRVAIVEVGDVCVTIRL